MDDTDPAERGLTVPDAEAGEAGLYSVVRQGVEEVRDPENSPAVSMAAYLVETRQEDLFRELSVYVERGRRARRFAGCT